jgi:hypothetical protein
MRSVSVKNDAWIAGACALAMAACEYDAPVGEYCPLTLCPPTGGARAAAPDPPAATAPAALKLKLLDDTGETLGAAATACAAGCLMVTAAAEGGEPPYAYVWSDGSHDATRRLCPQTAATYSVEVADSSPVPDIARASLTLPPCSSPSVDAASVPIPTKCRTVLQGFIFQCLSGMDFQDVSRLRPGEPNTIRIRGTFNVQLAVNISGVTSTCVTHALGSGRLDLLPGQHEASMCIVPEPEVEYVSAVAATTDLQILPAL